MLGARNRWFGISILFLVSACSTLGGMGGEKNRGHAEEDLRQAIKIYEDGDYPTAIVILQHALNNGLRSKSDQARVYKYLAFIHCVSESEKQCRDSFRKALEIDPSFNLQPAEAGHPVWGPVFRSVQSSRSTK